MIDAYLFSAFAKQAAESWDVLIFDFPAGMDFSLYSCLPDGTLFLTVAAPDPVSVRDSAAVGGRLLESSCAARLIINNFRYSFSKRRIFRGIDDIIDSSGLQLLGIVPYSSELMLLPVTHSLKPKSKPMSAFLRIAKRLEGERVLLPNLKKL